MSRRERMRSVVLDLRVEMIKLSKTKTRTHTRMLTKTNNPLLPADAAVDHTCNRHQGLRGRTRTNRLRSSSILGRLAGEGNRLGSRCLVGHTPVVRRLKEEGRVVRVLSLIRITSPRREVGGGDDRS